MLNETILLDFLDGLYFKYKERVIIFYKSRSPSRINSNTNSQTTLVRNCAYLFKIKFVDVEQELRITIIKK